MGASPEGHARIELDDDLAFRRDVIMPGCFDENAPADRVHPEVGFPSIGPVFLSASGDLQRRDGTDLAQVPDPAPDVFNSLGFDVHGAEVRAYQDRFGGIDG